MWAVQSVPRNNADIFGAILPILKLFRNPRRTEWSKSSTKLTKFLSLTVMESWSIHSKGSPETQFQFAAWRTTKKWQDKFSFGSLLQKKSRLPSISIFLDCCYFVLPSHLDLQIIVSIFKLQGQLNPSKVSLKKYEPFLDDTLSCYLKVSKTRKGGLCMCTTKRRLM